MSGAGGVATLTGGWRQGPLASSEGELHSILKGGGDRTCFHCVIGQLEGPLRAVSFKFLVLEMRSLPP